MIEKHEGWLGIEPRWLITNGYYCKECDYEILYSEQKSIKKIQKTYGANVLSNGKMLVNKKKIKEFIDKETGIKLKL